MTDPHAPSHSQVPTTEAPVDFDKALTWVDGDRELLSELVSIFLQDCPERLNELREAVAADDAGRTQRVAHGLKGAVTGFGATGARAFAHKLELIGKSGDLAEAPGVLRALEKELGRVIEGLSATEWNAQP